MWASCLLCNEDEDDLTGAGDTSPQGAAWHRKPGPHGGKAREACAHMVARWDPPARAHVSSVDITLAV